MYHSVISNNTQSEIQIHTVNIHITNTYILRFPIRITYRTNRFVQKKKNVRYKSFALYNHLVLAIRMYDRPNRFRVPSMVKFKTLYSEWKHHLYRECYDTFY